MSQAAARYVIIRFLPDQDAGEFINVGIVLASSVPEQVAWLLTPESDTTRLGAVFGEPGARVYREAARVFAAELDRLSKLVNGGWLSAQQTMNGLIKPRNGVLRFSETRAIMVEDCADAAAELFGRLVKRDRSVEASPLSGALAEKAPERN